MGEMSSSRFARNIARCRLALIGMAIVAVFIDPTHPMVGRWVTLTGGRFAIDPSVLAVLGTYFIYSAIILLIVHRPFATQNRFAMATTWGDVLFGVVIAALTEGASSPFHPFFAFAVLETGLRSGFRQTMLVTSVSVAFYLGLIVVSSPGEENHFIMRPVYLAITGYLVGYLGQQRLNLEEEIRGLAAANQRSRIARELHDGCVQSLAGINLRLESCRRLVQGGRTSDAAADIADLQASVTNEYDHLRSYMRSLAELGLTDGVRNAGDEPRVSVTSNFSASAALVDHVLQITREGLTNVRKHAQAREVTIRVVSEGRNVAIHVDDDGRGFRDGGRSPWSISSRVTELGGMIRIVRDERPGAHLAITLPQL